MPCTLPTSTVSFMCAPLEPAKREAPGSKSTEPRPHPLGVHRAEQAPADLAVVVDIRRREVRVRRIPDVGLKLDAPDEVLEGLFVLRAVEDERGGFRIAHGSTESRVQTPRDAVDELAHVILLAAVVVAEEQSSSW